MNYFVYSMNGKAPAPASGGTTGSWFVHYKWDVGGEAFVPVPVIQGAALPNKGDTICFVMDRKVLGFAKVHDVRDTGTPDTVEVCYDTRGIIGREDGDPTHTLDLPTGVVSGEQNIELVAATLRIFAATYPKRVWADAPPAPESLDAPLGVLPEKRDGDAEETTD